MLNKRRGLELNYYPNLFYTTDQRHIISNATSLNTKKIFSLELLFKPKFWSSNAVVGKFLSFSFNSLL